MPKKKIKSDKTLTDTEQRLAHEHEARLRLASEYANYQKRVEQELKRIHSNAKSDVLEKLFPVLDNLYRASTHAPAIELDGDLSQLSEEDFKQINKYFQGLRQIEKQLEDVLAQNGLTRIKTTGEQFDHNLHEAISYEPSDLPAETIIGEIEAGWQIDGKVLKPAKVRVSKGLPSSNS